MWQSWYQASELTDLRSEWEGETESKKRARVTELGGRAAIVGGGEEQVGEGDSQPNQTRWIQLGEGFGFFVFLY